MAKDFKDLFYPIKEVQEDTLYNLIEEVYSLIESKLYNPVPNSLRKFYECLLYRCDNECDDFRLIYHENKNDNSVNIYDSSKILFKKDYEFFKNTIQPFLLFTNKYSHCSDVNYSKLKKQEIYKFIQYIIDIWNWYAKNIRNLDSKYIFKEKFDLPKPVFENYISLQNKLESKTNKLQQLQDENKQIKDELENYKNSLSEQSSEQQNDSNEEILIDMNELEQDITETINLFITKNLYCTHRTIALFLLGDRIAQTDYANLAEMNLFGKYSKRKFSEFEYDLAIQQLLIQEKIIQADMYFLPFENNSNIFTKFLTKLKVKFKLKNINKRNYSKKVNAKYTEIIQKAIDEDKKIKTEYYKAIPNTGKTEKSIRILKPVIMVPKECQQEIYDETLRKSHKENLYYLGAIDDKDNKLKQFRLDGIKNPKII